MAAQQTVKDPEFQLYSLAIQPVFWENLQEVLDFTLNQWGATVMYEFLKKYPYIIIYSIVKNKVTVLNILHTSRNPQTYKKLTQQTRNK